jgi:signal transduction histidine kinase/HPt (histidine-containing phosphotransfer) domain-containing protein/ActR/RegA family two-component response regulator
MILVVMGTLSYSYLTGLLNEMMREVETNEEVAIIKDIQQSFANVELANVSFKIYDDSNYYKHFSNEMSTLKENVNQLNNLTKSSDSKELSIYKRLVFNKINLMDTLMAMELMPNYENYLKKLKTDISTIPAIKDNDKFLVGGKRVTQAYLAQSGKVFAKVKEVLDEVKMERKIAYDKINKQLVLLTDSLSYYSAKIAKIKQSKAISKGDIANSRLAVIKWMIVLFCILASFFLVALISIIVRYLRKNALSNKILKNSKLKAENLANTKEEFLANMSHEIRTPLNAIVGFTNQLVKSKQAPEQVDQINIIKKSSEHLLHIVNEILDYSKLENGSIKLENVLFNPTEIANEVRDMMLQKSLEREVHLSVEVAKNIPKSMIGDPVRIRQIILNLVSNAIKFTENGNVFIRLKCNLLIDRKIDLIIEVEDSGIGIPKDKIDQIFNMFVQAESDTTRKYGGTGLGLTICKRIVDVYGGTIDVESEPNIKTIISVSIPLEIAEKEEKLLKRENNNDSIANNLKGRKILIVDDQEFNRKLLSVMFKNWGVKYAELDDGIQVIDELEQNSYDLILMDIRMLVMDGIETTKLLRNHSNEELSKIPVIGVTAAITPDDKEAGLQAGMNDFLTKPFTEDKLLRIMEKYLPLSPLKPKESEVVNSLNLSGLIDISAGDDSFIINLLEVYLKTSLEGFKKIKTAIKEKDKKEIREQAHKISSPNKYIGAEHIYELLKELELKVSNDASWKSLTELNRLIIAEFEEVKKQVIEKLNELK